MGTEKFRRLAALVGTDHFLPKGYASAGVVTRPGGQLKANAVGFRFMTAAEAGGDQRLVAGVGHARPGITNPQHCGECGKICNTYWGSTFVCNAGKCGCPTGKVQCGNDCVFIETNVGHCGACGNKCPSGASCTGGQCVCPTSQTNCGAGCKDLKTDAKNCGACGKTCGQSESCVAGACTCAAPQGLCDGSCTDFTSDAKNCGACGVECPVLSGGIGYCLSGTCYCQAPNVACGDTCVHLQTSSKHCGKCNAACPVGQTCTLGKCG